LRQLQAGSLTGFAVEVCRRNLIQTVLQEKSHMLLL
jgi:hypothetical protein